MSNFVIGIDPGAHTGMVVARRRLPNEADKHGYIVAHHWTDTTNPGLSVTERLKTYRRTVKSTVKLFLPRMAVVEVPWRMARSRNALSIYTRGHMNVGSIGLLCAITGCILSTLDSLGIPAIEVPSPTGKTAKDWEKQKEVECQGIYGAELKKHEAVAAMLALKGL